MTRSLVIGGNGFIGSHLVDQLGSLGHSVRVLDRFSGGQVRYAREGVERVTGDFLNSDDLARATKGVDLVFHFLSITTPVSTQRDPLIDLRTNVAASIELMSRCAASGVSKLYFASTGGAIYGDQVLRRSLRESDVCRPKSPYAIGKLAIEGYLRYFASSAGLKSTSLRISNPYGPRQQRDRSQGVIPIFIRKVLAGDEVTVFGDGEMVRDYIYVEDVARQVAELSQREHDDEILNVASGQGRTVNEVLREVELACGRAAIVRNAPKPPTFVDHVVLDNSAIQRILPTTAATRFSAGIRATVDSIMGELAEGQL